MGITLKEFFDDPLFDEIFDTAAELDMDKHENEIVDGPQEQGEDDEKKKVKEEREER